MVAVTPQGQQVAVTQIQRPLLPNSTTGTNIPATMASLAGNLNQTPVVQTQQQ